MKIELGTIDDYILLPPPKKKVVCSGQSVCLFVCLSVCLPTRLFRKVLNGF